MAAQMCKTEILLNVLGHRFCDGPYVPALYVGPTEKQVRSMSSDRVRKLIASTPVLMDRLEGGQRDKVTEKYFAGVRLGFAWAGSPTELASHPAGLVLVDERDRMTADIRGEGDPVEIARARTKNYLHGKVGVVSTCTIEGASPIVALWSEGTRMKWCWPCPDCGELFAPRLCDLWWPEQATPQVARRDARLCCPRCGVLIADDKKPAMNAGGRYVPHDVTEAGDHVPIASAEPNSCASFWVSGLASPWRTFGQAAELVLRAYASQQPERIQAAVNLELGETWRVRGDAPAWEEVMARRGAYAPRERPHGAQIVTLGADVQRDGIYYVVRGWGFNAESWLLEHGYIPGETEYDSVWLLLGQVQQHGYGDPPLHIARAFVDSGYRPGDRWRRPDNAIYAHCRRHAIACPTKGHDTQDRPIKSSMIDVSIGGRAIKDGVRLYHLDTDYLKTTLFGRIRWPTGEPGAWHLHAQIDEAYCRQIVSEELLVTASGQRRWIRRSRENHFLDCEILALAAALTLQVHSLPRPDAPAPEPAPGAPKPSFVAPARSSAPRESFFRRRS